MRNLLLIFCGFITLASCKKSSDKNNTISAGTASYGAAGSTDAWSVPYMAHNNIEAPGNSTDCIFYTVNKVYEFYLTQQYPTTTYGLTFAIPSTSFPNFTIPLNQQLAFNLTSANANNVVSLYSVSFSSTEAVAEADSISLLLTITRISNNTIDGKFEFEIFGDQQSAYVNNGLFTNMPYKTE